MLEGNEITGNNTDDWEASAGRLRLHGGGKFWATNGAREPDNYVHDNRGVGLWADNNNVGFLFQGNYVSGNDAEGIMYETSYNAAILTTRSSGTPSSRARPTRPSRRARSTSPSRAVTPGRRAVQPELPRVGNVLIDNWSGVVAWENADRFAGSAADTSTGSQTLVNPSVATVEACGQRSNISKEPYFDDCRWKTQNVLVDGNTFRFDYSQIRSAPAPKDVATTGSSPTTAPIPAGRPTRPESCRRTSPSSRTTSGGTTPTSATGLSWSRRRRGSTGKRGDRHRITRTRQHLRLQEYREDVGTCRTSQGRHPDGPRSIGCPPCARTSGEIATSS